MWLLVPRQPRPDALYWRGRRLLAVIDAALWPVVWVLLLSQVPKPAGIVFPFAAALALLSGAARVRRALWFNHRYWFTTWRWGKVLASMFVIGAVLKLSTSA
jgi:hypothetical protein